MTPTPEQESILACASSPDSLLIEALAGAAKTTTLIMLASKLPLVPTFCCAFNKKIADEMQRRMPSHITCKTLNAIGHQVWSRKLNRRIMVDSGKSYNLVKALTDSSTGPARKFINENFSSLLKALRYAKSYGYVPFGQYYSLASPLTDEREFIDGIAPDLDCEPDQEFMDLVNLLLEKSIAQSYSGDCDFDDQLYMPTLFGGEWPRYPIVMVDEAQDLSALNHEMLFKMCAGRLIAVGDPNQSIYGFRGAHSNSMEVLQHRFNMTKMTLSVSFRCPQAVVKACWYRVPQFKWVEGAPEGQVVTLTEWNHESIPPDGVILCRANAPLFSCALRLLKAGKPVQIVGKELGPGLIKLLRKMGNDSTPQSEVLSAIDSWLKSELADARESRKASIQDRAGCLKVFAEFGPTLSAAVAYAEHLFSASTGIKLMSIHKSKGLEFPFVFYLDPWRIPSRYAVRMAESGDEAKLQQEYNLQYVAYTRAMESLYFIDLENYE